MSTSCGAEPLVIIMRHGRISKDLNRTLNAAECQTDGSIRFLLFWDCLSHEKAKGEKLVMSTSRGDYV
jgi:hypothetical protein